MKTSNKLIIVAGVLVFSFLVLHDFALQAEFKKGDYLSTYYHMEKLPIEDFDEVDLAAEGFTSLNFKQGPKFEVWVNSTASNELIFTKKGRVLNISRKGSSPKVYSEKKIIIICPQLKSLATRPFKEVYYARIADIIINNFKQDSMYLQTSRASDITLFGSTINSLTAGSDTSGGTLSLSVFNHIKDCNINMKGESTLSLTEKPGSGKVLYKLSPNTRLNLSGNAVNLFARQ
jgi:hypothetical protein